MSIPSVQPLLLPVLRALAGGSVHKVKEIRDRVATELQITPAERQQFHAKRRQNVYDNRVAFALAYFNMGKAITKKCDGEYQIAQRGDEILASNVRDLTIKVARNA